MFKVKNKDTRTMSLTSLTSFWCFSCKFWTKFTTFYSVSIDEFEQVNVSRDLANHVLNMFKRNKKSTKKTSFDVLLVSFLFRNSNINWVYLPVFHHYFEQLLDSWTKLGSCYVIVKVRTKNTGISKPEALPFYLPVVFRLTPEPYLHMLTHSCLVP